MFKNQSIRFQFLFSIFVVTSFLVLVAGLGLRSAYQTQASLDHFYSDLFRSMSKLQTIQDIYDGVVRTTIHRLLTKTVDPSEVVDVVDEAVAAAEIHWKSYAEVEKAKDVGGRHLLNNEYENAMDAVNVAWLTLKGIIRNNEPERVQQYIVNDLYPRLDALNRRCSQLMNRWMDQLDNDRQAAQDEAIATRKGLAVAAALGVLTAIFLAMASVLKVSRAVNNLVDQIEKIHSEHADLTKRIVISGNDEMRWVSQRFNYFLDSLLGTIRRLKISGLAVATAMPEITDCSKDMARRINDFSNFTTEVGATANEISATSQELVKLMTDVSDTATKTAELATSGQSELGRLETTMSQMEEASRQISKRLAVISEKAANITTVVTTINKFADQTNLLSLNASIEAEKAGEYGLGFAVVAREIRRLADQVALATLDIEQMVKEMKSAVSSGVMEMDKFTDEVRHDVRDVRNIGSQLAQIIEHVQTLLPCFESVHGAVQAQADGARQISDSMVQLSEAVDEASGTLRDNASTVGELTQASMDLQKEVSGFRVDLA
jgi:methyl-accepting chemotaxis protein WspA